MLLTARGAAQQPQPPAERHLLPLQALVTDGKMAKGMAASKQRWRVAAMAYAPLIRLIVANISAKKSACVQK